MQIIQSQESTYFDPFIYFHNLQIVDFSGRSKTMYVTEDKEMFYYFTT